MFEKILVLTDFSAYAHKFLEYVGDLPEVKDVVILNVVSKSPQEKVWDQAAKVKDAQKKLENDKKVVNASDANVTVRAVSVPDENIYIEVPKALQRVANEENVNLVVMGARGRSLIQSTLLGSTSRNFLRNGDKNLLIMRYKASTNSSSGPKRDNRMSSKAIESPQGPEAFEKFGDKILSKVLIPTDFSQAAEATFSVIKGMKGVEEIVLLHVVSRGESYEEIEAFFDSAADKLSSISEELSKVSLKAKPLVAIGYPTEEIRKVAEEEDVSLIAISSAGENAWRVGKIGAIAYDVANTSNRPVLVIRHRMT